MSKGNSAVLIVGEPGPMRDSLQMVLSALCQVEKVELAATAESALRMIAQHQPALVVYHTDLAPNDMETVLAAVTKLQSRSLVIADDREQQMKATAAGANVAVLKGYRAARLLEIVESLLCHSEEEPQPSLHGSNYD